MVDKKDVVKKVFRVGQVATQTESVIMTPDGEVLSVQEALVLVLNKLDVIERGIL